MTALVLGATGLIGSQVRAELERRGMDVVGTSTTPGRSDLAVDLTDAGQVEHQVGGHLVDGVLHLRHEVGRHREVELADQGDQGAPVRQRAQLAGRHREPFDYQPTGGRPLGSRVADPA